MLEEFKKFILRGNVIDLAVGFIMGAAFSKIVTSLVNDVIMPPIGLALGKVDFSNLFFNISGTVVTSVADAKKAGTPVIAYGLFLNTLFEFIIVAAVLFVIIRAVNHMTEKPKAPPPPSKKDCPYCVSEIPIKATRCPNCTSELA